jgi:hypothetical protein
MTVEEANRPRALRKQYRPMADGFMGICQHRIAERKLKAKADAKRTKK